MQARLATRGETAPVLATGRDSGKAMAEEKAAFLRREAIKARALAQNIGEQNRDRLLAIALTLEAEAQAIDIELKRLGGTD